MVCAASILSISRCYIKLILSVCWQYVSSRISNRGSTTSHPTAYRRLDHVSVRNSPVSLSTIRVAATSSGCKIRKSTSTIGFVAKTQGRYVYRHKLVGKPNMSTLLHVMSLVLSPTPLLTLPTVTSGEKRAPGKRSRLPLLHGLTIISDAVAANGALFFGAIRENVVTTLRCG